MGLDTEYVEYGVEISLAILGLSAAYFIDPSRPVTFLSLLFVPALYGYTAYISREGFNPASLVGLSSLIFVVVGGLTALIAVFYGVGNVLVSYFSPGSRFKDFYGSTSLPMLLMGLVVGSALFGYGSIEPGFQNNLAEMAGERTGDISGQIVSTTDLVEGQKQAQIKTINSTASLTYQLTTREILNNTQGSSELRQAFKESRDDVERQVFNRFNQKLQQKDIDLSGRIEDRITQQLKQINFLLIIPIVGSFFYSLQPILGILTGICGKIFLLLDS